MFNFAIVKLSGKKIHLRAIEPSDIEALYRWENDTSLWKLSNTLVPFSRDILNQYIANAHLDIYTTKQLRLMICNDNQDAVGCIDLFDFDPNNRRAGIGILIADKQNRENGFASEALELLIAYCFDTLHLHQLYCNIACNNEASLNLFKKMKFAVVGNKKEWIREGNTFIDEYILQLINK